MSGDQEVPTKLQVSPYRKWMWWLIIALGAGAIVDAIASRESSKSRTVSMVLYALMIVSASWSLLINRKSRVK